MRTALSFLVAAIVVPLVPAIVFASQDFLPNWRGLESATHMLAIAYFYSAAFVWVLGLPVYFILRRVRKVSLVSATISGLVLGILVDVLLRSQSKLIAIELVEFALIGAVTGATFYKFTSLLNIKASEPKKPRD